ncbi:hypothetical protein A0H81_10682 [Grifola frondosa]|uniref:DUF6534 domain-containing protein n=1 Tax=Grifola frondosa TaxID=5627 RepID=A0A1C7LZ28_GRIFR|nr:hypothetical protein A0H81_10682 [Grifola frondosa]
MAEGANIAFAVESFQSDYFELANFSWILYLNFGAALTADFIVTVSLCWLLARHRTGFQRTDLIIRLHLRTNSLHSTSAFCCLITFIKMPDNFIFIAFYFVKPKHKPSASLFPTYSHRAPHSNPQLLAMLNTRKHVREIGPSALMSIPLSAMSGTRSRAHGQRRRDGETHEEQDSSNSDSDDNGCEVGLDDTYRCLGGAHVMVK